jgi:hypothetical protein
VATSASATVATPASSGKAIQLENVQDIVFGFSDPDDTSWPRQMRVKDGALVQVELITCNPTEEALLLRVGTLHTYVQIVGTKRGDSKSSVCMCCCQRVTIASTASAGNTNALVHLKRTGCGAHGIARAAAYAEHPSNRAKKKGDGLKAERGTEWTFDEKLEYHAQVSMWMAESGRPEHMCTDPGFRRFVNGISNGGYLPPSNETIKRMNQICEDLTFNNIVDSLERAFEFAQFGAIPFLSLCYDSWTSIAGDTYLSVDLSYYDPGASHDGATFVTLDCVKLEAGHDANTLALKLADVFRRYGLWAAPLQYDPPQTAKAHGKKGQFTDLSAFVRGQTTDDGGGVMKNVALETNTFRDWCALHKLDLPARWALGQA